MTDFLTVYMPLLDEGVDVWRPVKAEALPDGLFLVHGPMSDDEAWAFPPGSVVKVAYRRFSDGESLMAIEYSHETPSTI